MDAIGLVNEELTGSVIGAFFEVYDALGYGFLEHIYKAALERELRSRGHRVAREIGVTVVYKGKALATQRLDMLVDEKVVVEIKATGERPEIGSRQLFSYLRATSLEIGLLLCFGPRASFKRVVCLNSRPRHMPGTVPRRRTSDSGSEPSAFADEGEETENGTHTTDETDNT